MKTTKILKTIVLSAIILTIFSCKKEKQPEPQQPSIKNYVVQYKAQISGPGVTGSISYYDPDKKQVIQEIIIGTNITRAFVFKEGSYATITGSAASTSGNSTITVEIYVENTKRYSNTNTSLINSYASADGIIN